MPRLNDDTKLQFWTKLYDELSKDKRLAPLDWKIHNRTMHAPTESKYASYRFLIREDSSHDVDVVGIEILIKSDDAQLNDKIFDFIGSKSQHLPLFLRDVTKTNADDVEGRKRACIRYYPPCNNLTSSTVDWPKIQSSLMESMKIFVDSFDPIIKQIPYL